MNGLLSETDKFNIKSWISENVHHCDIVPMEDIDILNILQPWSEAKGDYLYKLMGNQLILQKPYAINDENIGRNKISEALYSGSVLAQFKDVFLTFIKTTDKYEYISGKRLISYILDSYWLYENRFPYAAPIIIQDKASGKKFKLEENGKIIKFIQKLGTFYNLPYTQEFVNEHSRILNQSKVKGKLCLSIHPLDYMTMSDNANSWTSCMSWEDCGCYKQGTVEMMNSPKVIVAYLANDNYPFILPNGNEWYNKKWRCLYIVDKNIITTVKSYPNQPEGIELECLNWIKELATQNVGWEYEDKPFNYCSSQFVRSSTNQYVKITPDTNYMYNDCINSRGSKEGIAYLTTEPDTPSKDTCYYYSESYSGADQCMICGKTYSIEHASYLYCENCIPYLRCAKCGSPLEEGSDEIDYYNDEPYCEDCAYTLEECTYCGCYIEDSKRKWYIDIYEENGLWLYGRKRYCEDCLRLQFDEERWNSCFHNPSECKIDKENKTITIKINNLTEKGKELILYY